MRQGQISIDYVAGALLFFLSLTFVITGILSTVPQFTDQIENNRLEASAWRLSTALLTTPGHWENTSGGGSDWQQAPADDIRQVGLATPAGGIARSKLQRADQLSYDRLRQLLEAETHFRMSVREYLQVDTSRSYRNGTPPTSLDGFQPPDSHPVYDDYNGTVNYGSVRINGETQHWLVVQNQSMLQAYRSESWDFRSPETTAGRATYNGSETDRIAFGPRTYLFDGNDAGIQASGGKLVVLQRPATIIGRRTPAYVDNTVAVTRFTNIEEIPVRVRMEVWFQ